MTILLKRLFVLPGLETKINFASNLATTCLEIRIEYTEIQRPLLLTQIQLQQKISMEAHYVFTLTKREKMKNSENTVLSLEKCEIKETNGIHKQQSILLSQVFK